MTDVVNGPAGGPQEFASTNDHNQNPVLSDKPFVVVAVAHGQIGVVDRYGSEADANAAASARKAAARDAGSPADFRVVKENDPTNGLPALLAEVEGAELGTAPADEPKAKAPATK